MSENKEVSKSSKTDHEGGLSAPVAAQKMGGVIKFRQAITEDDGTFHWHYWGYLHTCTKGLPVFINPRPPLEHDLRPSHQYIGRKDVESGIDVYVGDIVQRPASEAFPVCRGVVVWRERAQAFLIDLNNGHAVFTSLWRRVKILGNTTEHPGLLKADNEAIKAS